MPDPSPIPALEHAIATATDLAKVRAEVLAAMDADRITSVQARQLLESMPEPRTGRVWGNLTRVWANTWEAACKRSEVSGFRFHDLRHTWASWHAMAGTPLSVLQELGGWHSHEMVQRYAHLSPEHLAAAAERVGL